MQKRIAHRQERERRLVSFARKHLGKPYKYGARPWQAPRFFDCSSFVQYLYHRIGIELPRVSIDQARRGRRVPRRRSALRVGDCIFISGAQGRYNQRFPQGIGHVVLYVGDGKVIHAEGVRYRRVVEQPVKTILGRKDVVVIRRYL